MVLDTATDEKVVWHVSSRRADPSAQIDKAKAVYANEDGQSHLDAAYYLCWLSGVSLQVRRARASPLLSASDDRA